MKPRCTLAVDQATSSGYAMHVGLSPLRWGLALTALERRAVLQMARSYSIDAADRDGWFLFLYEDHSFASKQRGHGTLIGQLHRWLEQLDLMGHPPALRFGVSPNTWQRRVLGCALKTKRDERKRQSMAWASAHVRSGITSDDVSDALCISAFGALEADALIARRAFGEVVKRAARKVRKRRRRVI